MSLKNNPWLQKDKEVVEKKEQPQGPKPKPLARDSPFGKKEEQPLPAKSPATAPKPLIRDSPFFKAEKKEAEPESKPKQEIKIAGPSLADRKKMLAGLNFDPHAQVRGPPKPKVEKQDKGSDDSYISDDEEDSKPAKKTSKNDDDEYPPEKVDYKEKAAQNTDFLAELRNKVKKPQEVSPEKEIDQQSEADIWGEAKETKPSPTTRPKMFVPPTPQKNDEEEDQENENPLEQAEKQESKDEAENTADHIKKTPEIAEPKQNEPESVEDKSEAKVEPEKQVEPERQVEPATKKLLDILADESPYVRPKTKDQPENVEEKQTSKKKKILFDDDEEDEQIVKKPIKKPKKKLFDDDEDDDI